MPPDRILSFGPYRLDAANARLWCETRPVRLTTKALQVLNYLVEHPGQLVTKDELFGAVWPDTVVSDATLASNIQAVRQALGDDPRSPRFIETVHRQGFRFLGEVVRSQQEEVKSEQLGVSSEELAIGSEPEKVGSEQIAVNSEEVRVGNGQAAVSHPWRRTGWLFIGLFLVVGTVFLIRSFFPSHLTAYTSLLTEEAKPSSLPLPDKPSLIVLPLVNFSGDPEQEYFSDGLTEVLTGTLSRISSLFVIARNSAFTYKGKAVKVQDVSREMGVRYVLEGSVQRANQRVRVNVQLIEAPTGYHLWSGQYDRPLTDIFTLQDEIVQKIVTTLKLQLTLEEQGYIVRKHTDNLEAYDAFLRGQEYLWRFTKEAFAQARQQFEKAVALDPQYAEAYAIMGLIYFVEWTWRWSAAPQTLEHAFALVRRAVALDDSLPTAHAILGMVYVQQQQYDQAIREGEWAIALDPNNADSYLDQTETLMRAGRPEEALQAMKQAMRLNPHYPPLYSFELGWACHFTGRYGEAITMLKETIRRSPNLMPAYILLANSYLWQWVSQQSPAGQTLEPAVEVVQQAPALSDSYHWNHMTSGLIYLYQQHDEQALAEMERAVALAPNEADSYALLAEVLSDMGRTKEALEASAQALRLKSEIVDDHLASVGSAYAIAGHYEEARDPLQRFLSRYPNFLPTHLMLAAVYSELGQTTEAQKEASEVLRLNPNFSLEVHRQRMPIKDSAVLERHIAALRKAGLK